MTQPTEEPQEPTPAAEGVDVALDKAADRFNVIAHIFVLFAVIAIAVTVALLAHDLMRVPTNKAGVALPEAKAWALRGAVGDAFGGHLAGGAGLAGFFLMFAAFLLQSAELKYQRRELQLTRDEMRLQRLETSRAAESQAAIAASQAKLIASQLRNARAQERIGDLRLLEALRETTKRHLDEAESRRGGFIQNSLNRRFDNTTRAFVLANIEVRTAIKNGQGRIDGVRARAEEAWEELRDFADLWEDSILSESEPERENRISQQQEMQRSAIGLSQEWQVAFSEELEHVVGVAKAVVARAEEDGDLPVV